MTAFAMVLPVFSILPRGGNDGVDLVHVHAGGTAPPGCQLHSGYRPHCPCLMDSIQSVFQRGRICAQQNGYWGTVVGQHHRCARF